MRRFTLLLALISALTGCLSAPPNGPLVEYHEGARPVTRRVKCEANYALVAKDASGTTGQIFEHHIIRGERIGFRRESDGSVIAIAPGHTLALPPGTYAWEVVPGSVASGSERLLCETREWALVGARATGVAILVVLVVAAVVGVVVLAGATKSNTSNSPY